MFIKLAREQIKEYHEEINHLQNKMGALIDFSSTPLRVDSITVTEQKQIELERIVGKLGKIAIILEQINKELFEELLEEVEVTN